MACTFEEEKKTHMHKAVDDHSVTVDNIRKTDIVDGQIEEDEESESIESEADNMNLEETQDDHMILL